MRLDRKNRKSYLLDPENRRIKILCVQVDTQKKIKLFFQFLLVDLKKKWLSRLDFSIKNRVCCKQKMAAINSFVWLFLLSRKVEDFSNKIATVFKSHGYRKGDTVGLLMENKPEYVATWLGLSKLGIIVPLINTNLRKSTLLHSLNVANCQALIYGSELSEGKTFLLFSTKKRIKNYFHKCSKTFRKTWEISTSN